MAKFDDFDLDVTKTAAQGGIEPKYKSKCSMYPRMPDRNPYDMPT